jgi:hypothetical protein
VNKETAEELKGKIEEQFPAVYVHVTPSGHQTQLDNQQYIIGVHEPFGAWELIAKKKCFIISDPWEWEKIQTILQVLGYIAPVASQTSTEPVETSTN